MISQGSKIQIPGRGDLGDVTLVSLQEGPEGFWTLSIESDDGSQQSEILSNEEMDAVIILGDQAAITGKSLTGQSDEKVLADNGTRRLNRRLVIMSFFGVVIIFGALIIAFRPGFINFPFGDGGSKKVVEEFEQTGQLDGRSVGEKSLGLNWHVVTGDWRIGSGQLSSNQSGSENYAYLPLQSLPKSFTVDWLDITEGSGLVFLRQDDLNYWKLVAMPSYGGWNLYSIKDGKSKFMAGSGLASTRKVNVEVRLSLGGLQVLINEKERIALYFPVNITKNEVGLFESSLSKETSTPKNKGTSTPKREMKIESIVIDLG